jgi:hypothetical protein
MDDDGVLYSTKTENLSADQRATYLLKEKLLIWIQLLSCLDGITLLR